jgi:predicted transcriptional regulator
VTAGAAAAAAVAANPDKTNRAIAGDLGVDEGTVRKARRSVAENSATGKRTGKDGKQYKAKKPKKAKAEPRQVDEKIAAFVSELVSVMARISKFQSSNKSMPTPEMRKGLVATLYQCADRVQRLAQAIDGRDPEAAWSDEWLGDSTQPEMGQNIH